MANGRNHGRKTDVGRDTGGFVALPWSVLDCPAYACLSHPARALLLEFARQFVRDNNGRMLASRAYLAKRGWKSADVIDRAKRELLQAGFIFETVKGQRPNRASWYAVTWRILDKLNRFDVGASDSFERGAYLKSQPLKNACLVPAGGLERPVIVPSDGLGKCPSVPSHGAIRGTFSTLSSPSHGHHLEKPSIANQTTR